MTDFETPDELARRLRIRRSTILTWAQAGIIPSIRVSAKVIRFNPEAVDTALSRLGNPRSREVRIADRREP